MTIAHHRTGKPHGWIHNELRRICGGPVVAAANQNNWPPASRRSGCCRVKPRREPMGPLGCWRRARLSCDAAAMRAACTGLHALGCMH